MWISETVTCSYRGYIVFEEAYRYKGSYVYSTKYVVQWKVLVLGIVMEDYTIKEGEQW